MESNKYLIFRFLILTAVLWIIGFFFVSGIQQASKGMIIQLIGLLILLGPLILFYLHRRFTLRNKKLSPSALADPLILQRKPKTDELMLGFAEGESEEEGRPVQQLKGIAQADRKKHCYVVGGSGSGKTRFLQSMILQDIQNGVSFGVVDPHGDLIEDIKAYLYLLQGATESPESDFFSKKVVLVDPTNKRAVVGFNPLERTRGIAPEAQAAELVIVFKKIWEESWGARMEDLLRNTLIALVENNLTLVELPRFLTDKEFRETAMEKVKHPICQTYFKRFNSLNDRTRNEWIESTLNKANAFLSNGTIRTMLSAPKSTIDFRQIMDEGKILLIKLDKGNLKDAADLLGSLLLSKIQMAAFSRGDIPRSQRSHFFLYIDEFQNYATKNFIEMLSEARKYGLAVILAHQNLSQLPVALVDSALTNCSLHVYFRLSRIDAQLLAKEGLTSLYVTPPGWEDLIQVLQQLPPRRFASVNKEHGGSVILTSLELPDPHELVKLEEQELRILVDEKGFGKEYLQKTKQLEKAHQTLLKPFEEKSEEPETFEEPKAE
jgi:hypothetical protein